MTLLSIRLIFSNRCDMESSAKTHRYGTRSQTNKRSKSGRTRLEEGVSPSSKKRGKKKKVSRSNKRRRRIKMDDDFDEDKDVSEEFEDIDDYEEEWSEEDVSSDVDEFGNLKGFIDYHGDRILTRDRKRKVSRKKMYEDKDEDEVLEDDLMSKLELLSSMVERVENLKDTDRRRRRKKKHHSNLYPDREYDSETVSEYANNSYDSDAYESGESDESYILETRRRKERKWNKKLTKEEKIYFKTLSKCQRKSFQKRHQDIVVYNEKQIPLRFKIMDLPISTQCKSYLLTRLNTFQNMDQSENEYHKLKNWFDDFNKIPINNYVQFPLSTTTATPEKICEFLKESRDTLNDAVYGHDSVKNEVIQIISQWITNPDSKGNVLALQGPMGNGKTTLAKNGLAKVLKRPFALIALGGAKDSAFLNGHEYTFEGSKCGRIVEVLRDLQCMNPIIFFDELDKLSDTATGQEISNLLCHITDPVQNSEFQDRYFSGIDFDLSKAIFVMSFNDESKVNSILKDRMHVIRMKGFGASDKVKIAKQYLIPSICEELNFKQENVLLSDDMIKHVVTKYTNEEGVRSLRRCLKMIYSKLNVINLVLKSTDTDMKDIVTFKLDTDSFPMTMNEERICELLKTSKNGNSIIDTSVQMMYM